MKVYRVKSFKHFTPELVGDAVDTWLLRAGPDISVESFNLFHVPGDKQSYTVVLCVLMDNEKFDEIDD